MLYTTTYIHQSLYYTVLDADNSHSQCRLIWCVKPVGPVQQMCISSSEWVRCMIFCIRQAALGNPEKVQKMMPLLSRSWVQNRSPSIIERSNTCSAKCLDFTMYDDRRPFQGPRKKTWLLWKPDTGLLSIRKTFPSLSSFLGIKGNSTGGHGPTMCGLRCPGWQQYHGIDSVCRLGRCQCP